MASRSVRSFRGAVHRLRGTVASRSQRRRRTNRSSTTHVRHACGTRRRSSSHSRAFARTRHRRLGPGHDDRRRGASPGRPSPHSLQALAAGSRRSDRGGRGLRACRRSGGVETEFAIDVAEIVGQPGSAHADKHEHRGARPPDTEITATRADTVSGTATRRGVRDHGTKNVREVADADHGMGQSARERREQHQRGRLRLRSRCAGRDRMSTYWERRRQTPASHVAS